MDKLDRYLESIQTAAVKGAGTITEISPAYLALMTAPHLIKLGQFAFNKMFSKAGKACAGMPPADKTTCLRKFKLQAYEFQLRTLGSSMSKCRDTKDPAECKDKLNKKIKSIQFKINILNQGLRKARQ